MFCGDTFSTLGGVETAARVNPRFPLVTLASWDRPTVLRSAGTLRALQPARLAPGHGRILESPLPGHGRGDQASRLSLPRRGLDRGQVLDAAVTLADEGLDRVTFARLAETLGVRAPSL